MKQNNKHKLAVLFVFILAILIGGSANEHGQLKGVLVGMFFTYIAFLITIKLFPMGVKQE